MLEDNEGAEYIYRYNKRRVFAELGYTDSINNIDCDDEQAFVMIANVLNTKD